jgi:AAA15 family ATPase/GTPase
MRLKGFSVANYRSITGAYNLTLSDYTVLVGPNNEGKSNILRALGVGLRLLSRGRALTASQRARPRVRYRDVERFDYIWKRDFPVSLQSHHPEESTVLHFTFQLDQEDCRDFRAKVGDKPFSRRWELT